MEAIEKVGLFMPDRAILDLGMPIMNGVQAAREISKANPNFRYFSLVCRKFPVNSQKQLAALASGERSARVVPTKLWKPSKLW